MSNNAEMAHKLTQTTPYGLNIQVALPYDVAVERTVEALAKEGFGVLTEADLQSTFKRKLDVTFRPYVILGACNPPLALQALKEEPAVGLLLPCNVVVYAGDDPDTAVVAAIDPIAQLGIAHNERLQPIASDVRARLERALIAVAGQDRTDVA